MIINSPGTFRELQDGRLNIRVRLQVTVHAICMSLSCVSIYGPDRVKWRVKTSGTIIIIVCVRRAGGKNARTVYTEEVYYYPVQSTLIPRLLKSPDRTSDTPREISISNASKIVSPGTPSFLPRPFPYHPSLLTHKCNPASKFAFHRSFFFFFLLLFIPSNSAEYSICTFTCTVVEYSDEEIPSK